MIATDEKAASASMYNRYFRRMSAWNLIGILVILYLVLRLKYVEYTATSSNTKPCTYGASTDIIGGDDVLKYQVGWTKQDHPGLIQYIKQQWLHGPSTENYQLDSKPDEDVSQCGQSKFVDDYLRKRENGFFVECGAANGHSFSNTLMLERLRGWTGLLIEANPFFYREILETRRNAYSINVCLSIQNRTDQLKFRPAGLFGGLANSMDETHLRAVNRFGPVKESVTAQCFNIYSILLALGRTRVDYFSLDVEGPELDILRTIPLEKLHIDMFSVEYRLSDNVNINEEGSLAKLEQIRNFFESTGLYDEVGIVPSGSHDNPMGTDSKGLDVIFKRR